MCLIFELHFPFREFFELVFDLVDFFEVVMIKSASSNIFLYLIHLKNSSTEKDVGLTS